VTCVILIEQEAKLSLGYRIGYGTPHNRQSIAIAIASPVAFDILGFKRMRSRVWLFGITWRHRSRDHLIPHRPVPICGVLEPIVYLLVSEIFNDEYDAMVDMTINDL